MCKPFFATDEHPFNTGYAIDATLSFVLENNVLPRTSSHLHASQ